MCVCLEKFYIPNQELTISKSRVTVKLMITLNERLKKTNNLRYILLQ